MRAPRSPRVTVAASSAIARSGLITSPATNQPIAPANTVKMASTVSDVASTRRRISSVIGTAPSITTSAPGNDAVTGTGVSFKYA